MSKMKAIKFGDLTVRQLNAICKDHYAACDTCPLNPNHDWEFCDMPSRTDPEIELDIPVKYLEERK